MRILIIGHFGGRNIGDEIILLSQMQMLTKKFGKCEFLIYTYNEDFTVETYKKYDFNIKTVKAFGLRNSIHSTIDQIKKIKNIDFAILGGGGLIQDIYFSYGIFRYLLPIYICLLRRIPFYTFAIGIYRFNYNLNKNLFKFAINHSNGLSVRDKISIKNVKALNSDLEIHEIPDSALTFDKDFLTKSTIENHTLTLVFRDFFEPYLNSIKDLVSKLKDKYGIKKINLVIFENNQNEIALAIKMKDLLKNDLTIKIEIYNDMDPISYLNILNISSLVITGRLHGLLPSIILEKNILCLSYAPKIKSFCESNKIPFLEFEDLKNIEKIVVDDYIYDSSKIKILSDETYERSNNFLSLIEKTYKNKPLLKESRLLTLCSLIFSGLTLLSIHVMNKILNKKFTQE